MGMTYTCKGPRLTDEDGNFNVTDIGLSLRRGCGADLTELIEAVAVDSQDHTIECPKCGNHVSLRRVPAEDVSGETLDG